MTSNADGPGAGPIWAAFLCGAIAGAAVAVLFAPASGRETRSRLRARARDLVDARREYIERLEAELQHWSGWIENLASTLGPMSTEARAQFETQLADLRARRDQARRTLDDLRSHGGAAWQDLVAGVDRAWHELRQGVESAASRFA